LHSIRHLAALVLALGCILLTVSVANSQEPPKPRMTPNGLIAPDGSKPLPPLADTLSWSVLQEVQSVKTQSEKGEVWIPKFTDELKKMNAKPVKLYGFMIPTQAGETQKEFVLTPYPPSCPFCLTMGPNSVVQVICDEPAKVTFEPVVVSGKLAVMESDESGFYYRITGASAAEQP
jgi:uncharacterized protein